LTQDLIRSGQILKIDVLDRVIVGKLSTSLKLFDGTDLVSVGTS
jgi:DNA repair protein RadC